MRRLATLLLLLPLTMIGFMAEPVSASASPDVQPWLLTVSDMPQGWAAYGLSRPVAQGCWSPLQDVLALKPGSWAGTNYEDIEGFAFATEVLFSWPSAATAQKAWATTTARLTACREFVSSAGLQIQVEPINLGRFGDASAAWFSTSDLGWSFAVLLVRKGQVVAALVYTLPIADFETGMVLPFVREALAKLPVAVSQQVQPLVLSAYATPARVGPHGGQVTIAARLKNAATCHLEVLSRQGFPVVYANNVRPCGRVLTARVTVGANTTAVERHIAFALVARNKARSFTARLWVAIAPRVIGR